MLISQCTEKSAFHCEENSFIWFSCLHGLVSNSLILFLYTTMNNILCLFVWPLEFWVLSLKMFLKTYLLSYIFFLLLVCEFDKCLLNQMLLSLYFCICQHLLRSEHFYLVTRLFIRQLFLSQTK